MTILTLAEGPIFYCIAEPLLTFPSTAYRIPSNCPQREWPLQPDHPHVLLLYFDHPNAVELIDGTIAFIGDEGVGVGEDASVPSRYDRGCPLLDAPHCPFEFVVHLWLKAIAPVDRAFRSLGQSLDVETIRVQSGDIHTPGSSVKVQSTVVDSSQYVEPILIVRFEAQTALPWDGGNAPFTPL